MRRVARLDTANTPEFQDHRIGHSSNDLYTARNAARLGMTNTPIVPHVFNLQDYVNHMLKRAKSSMEFKIRL
jgi:hypothetical protein